MRSRLRKTALRTSALMLSLGALLTTLPALSADLTIARSVDADGLDPQKASTTQSLQVTNLIFDTLLTMDKDGSVHPGLASEWSMSDNGKSYSFTIRDGVKCHDGSVFDAAAAKASVDRALDPATVNPNLSSWGPISGTSVDGKALKLTLSEPYGPFASFLTSIQAAFICPSSVAGSEFKPIGTGPFKFASWTRNDSIKLEANTDYANVNPLVKNPGKPHIDTLMLKVIPEAVARMAALRSGEVDMVEPSLEEAADLKADSNFKVYSAELSGQQMLAAFTWKIKPLDNPDIRKAIGMAMNRDAYASIAFEGLVNTSNCPVAPNLFATDEALCATWGVTYDPEAAKALMAKAGYGPDKPLKVKLLVHKLPGWDAMHQIMQQDLAAIGVEAEIETREVAAFFDHMKGVNEKTDGEPAVWTMGMSGVDPDYLYFLWKQPGFVNMGLNADVDAMLEEQRKLSGDARAAKIHEIQKYLMENAYAIPLLSPGWGWLMASTSKVDGFTMGFSASLIFNDVTKS
ncbi:peptide/nickel transport system substrate-binding protein [Rhizobium sp. PP-F2F-G38]|uniref:ABC transporter substrate-binding protein n=1 Tax=Ferranicluibacter rubi TaxID=2715133 RepID=A0AA43ZFT2_9HYPH|nr:ABC transporter substrate-binding protein [Ferranicluibacter rubi]NHT75631.1 ABC transporter substrate-binding protein [Ferranicluibacter rubi]PYE32690.1 peptide/nickel transport system substrate-binding protein [Rhizobium sp. PP-WC-1G-195]PYE96119.1 peptide/nickel transport system substrate-binding protein [Rhizobium sp. PP-F2F-G38]